MKSETALWLSLLDSLGRDCTVSTTRDRLTATRRINHSGLSFLTITLPSYCKDFERSLDNGCVSLDTSFHGWKRRAGLPAFLSGFLERVFDPSTGALRDDADEFAVFAVRQICLVYSKLDVPCSTNRTNKALRQYISTDKEISDNPLSDIQQCNITRVASLVFGPVLSMVDSDVYYQRIVPKHGPGSVQNRLSQNSKWNCTTWTHRLERVFPFFQTVSPREDYCLDIDVNMLHPDDEPPVRVITVPKTQKGPRIIAIEPSWNQYCQQGLLRSIVTHLKDHWSYEFMSWETSDDNHHLAFRGSVDGSLATLDLSEASDRVSVQHVESLLRNFPWFKQGAFASRSLRADVLGEVLHLNKFASMGSALTFPFESMIFFIVTLLGMESAGHHLSESSIRGLSGQVRVFGDDIIVPTPMFEPVTRSLEAYGFKVNVNKSFHGCSFRESCGKEYFQGEDVTVARLRKPLPSNGRDAREIISLVEFRNHAFLHGLWSFCGDLLDNWIKEFIPFPIVEDTSPALGRTSFLCYREEKYDLDLHRPLVKAARISSRPPKDPLDGWGALSKYLIGGGNPFDPEHLERSGRPNSVFLRVGWCCPF